MPSWKKVITSGSDAHLKTINTDGNISGSSVSTGSFGRVETSTISGLSPLIIESDNVNVDSDGSVSGSSTSTGSFGTLRVGTNVGSLSSGLVFGDGDTGFYEHADDDVFFKRGGNTVFRANTSSQLDFGVSTLFFNTTGGFNIKTGAGAVGTPNYTFRGDTDTGMYRSADNVIGFTAGGALQLEIASNKISGSSTSTGSFGKVEATTLKGTLETAAQGNVTSLGTLTTLTVDDITLNGSTISDSGDLTMDVGGDLVIDVDGTDVILKDGGTAFGRFKRDSSDFIIKSEANNEDIILRGQDGGSTIDALLLDMSEAGAATFGGGIANSGTISAGTWAATDIAVAHGGTGASDAAGARSNLGVDPAGTDNSTNVTLAGTPDYITISGQTITRNQIDLANDVTGTLPTSNVANTSGTNTGNSQTVWSYSLDGGGGASVSHGETLNIVAGDGIEFSESAARNFEIEFTTPSTLQNTSLKVGRDNDNRIDFSTDNVIKVEVNAVEDEFRFAAGGDFHADGDIIAFSSTTASDRKLKTNIQDTKYGLGDVIKLQGREFDWKQGERGHDVGFIAQEVQEVIPELVKEVTSLKDKGTHLTVNYEKLVPVLVESIKELKEEIDDIKKKCDCLNK